EAAKEIKSIVESATNKANEGKVIANDMIAGYSSLNDKISQTIELISNVSTASKEQESGIVQINDTVAVLDRATQVNASSATEINRLSNEVRSMAQNLLEIASKASYDKKRNNQTCDVDMVFQIAQLKNDHIVFKNTNFSKLSAKGVSSWRVTDHHSCNLGKWIDDKETKAEAFTKTDNWTQLKQYHKLVHENVQQYIDKNAQNKGGSELLVISNDLEDSMYQVFELLDKIKIENCNLPVRQEQKAVPTQKVQNSKPIEHKAVEHKKEHPAAMTAPKSNIAKKTEVITSKSKDDDEWESF
ncbi:MAG: CZB domain-containing protein, partial [Arcobacteraceae bacterium]|nr:CZB domain-containing protein [Arcobacteraceae bacterium]